MAIIKKKKKGKKVIPMLSLGIIDMDMTSLVTSQEATFVSGVLRPFPNEAHVLY